jgi:hypothetical protein
MNQPRILSVALAMALLCASPVIVFSRNETTIVRIEGHVATADDTPLMDVTVRIWRAGKVSDQVLTDGAGHFALTLEKGVHVDALTFDPPDTRFYGPAFVDNLSGKQDQQINLVLFGPQHFKSILRRATDKSNVDLSPIRRQLSAITRIVEIETGMPLHSDSDPLRYRQYVHRMRSDDALFGREEAAETDGYLEAFETYLERQSQLRGGKPDEKRDYPSSTTPEF